MATDDSDLEAARAAWLAVVDRDTATKGLGLGVNFRLDVVQALKAAFLSAKLYFKVHTAATIGVGDALGIGSDAFGFVVACLNACRQKLDTPAYVVAVVLSTNAAPRDTAAFRKELDDFIESGANAKLPWYIGIGAGDLAATKAVLAQRPDALELLLQKLEKEKLAEKTGDAWRYTPLHFRVTGSFEAG